AVAFWDRATAERTSAPTRLFQRVPGSWKSQGRLCALDLGFSVHGRNSHTQLVSSHGIQERALSLRGSGLGRRQPRRLFQEAPPASLQLNYKDCEKAVRKHHIDGPRFLNLAENDIQKFPKLRVPILSKLSQEINKNEERRSIFTRKPQVQRFPEETESHEEDNGGWSSFKEQGPDRAAQGSDNVLREGQRVNFLASPSTGSPPHPFPSAPYTEQLQMTPHQWACRAPAAPFGQRRWAARATGCGVLTTPLPTVTTPAAGPFPQRPLHMAYAKVALKLFSYT
uniref:Uncharacterized protein n=1 Tax=Sus scrofa TaxID=9823 RepID=A0A8D0SWC2_PIG